jgi:hypothetical protein
MFGRALVHDRNQLRQQVRAHGVDCADAQRARELVFALGGDVPDRGGFFEHALRLLDDARAERRHADVRRMALEQRDAQLLLEFLDRDGQGWLAHETFFGGAAEMPFARERDDVAQFGESHRAKRASRCARLPP